MRLYPRQNKVCSAFPRDTLEELQALLDELFDTDCWGGGDELTDDLLCRSLGIAEHLQRTDGLLRGSGVQGLYRV